MCWRNGRRRVPACRARPARRASGWCPGSASPVPRQGHCRCEGPSASVVKTPSSTALNSALEPQNPSPNCMMASGVTSPVVTCSPSHASRPGVIVGQRAAERQRQSTDQIGSCSQVHAEAADPDATPQSGEDGWITRWPPSPGRRRAPVRSRRSSCLEGSAGAPRSSPCVLPSGEEARTLAPGSRRRPSRPRIGPHATPSRRRRGSRSAAHGSVRGGSFGDRDQGLSVRRGEYPHDWQVDRGSVGLEVLVHSRPLWR